MLAWNVAIQKGILKNSNEDTTDTLGVKESVIFMPAPTGVNADDEVSLAIIHDGTVTSLLT